MSTVQVKDSCRRVKKFIKEGKKILNNNSDFKIFNSYYKYLISIDNKEKTILRKLRFIYLFEHYLYSKERTFKTFTKENVYDYFEECSKLSWEYVEKDQNKWNVKNFLNWTYQNNLTKISGNMILPKIVWHRKTNIRTYYTKEEIIQLLNIIDTKTNQR